MSNQLITEVILSLDKAKEELKKFSDGAKKEQKSLWEEIGGEIEKKIPSSLTKMATIAGGVFLAFEAVKTGIEAIQVGEKIQRIEAQFDVLAQKGGVVGESLKQSLEAAGRGMIPTVDLLAAANKSMIEFTGSAQKLPQVLELAGKLFRSGFGESAVANFEQLNTAIATGNTRALRSVGIFIDQDKTMKTFAQSIGVLKEELTLAGRQQAVLNAALERGKNAFDGINAPSNTATGAFKKLSVSVHELYDAFAVALSDKFGPALANIVNAFAEGANRIKTSFVASFGHGADQASAKIDELGNKIKSLQAIIDNSAKTPGPNPFAKAAEVQLSKLNEEYAVLIKNQQRSIAQANKAIGGSNTAGGVSNEELANQNLRITNALAFEDKRTAIQASAAQQRLANLENEGANYQQIQAAFDEVQIANRTNFEFKIAELNHNFYDLHLMNLQQFLSMREAILAENAAKERAIEDKKKSDIINLNKQWNTMMGNIALMGVQSIGAALVKGGKAFDDFKNFALNALGDMSISIGKTMIVQSAAFQAMAALISNPFTAAAGSLAFGLALVALGGVLKAAAGGGGEGAAGGVSSPGSAGGGSEIGPQGFNSNLVQQAPSTQVQLVVQGNVLDRRATGLELVNVLNEAFGSQGVVVTG